MTYAEKALAADAYNFAAQKWTGILISWSSEFQGYKRKIERSYEIKDHFLVRVRVCVCVREREREREEREEEEGGEKRERDREVCVYTRVCVCFPIFLSKLPASIHCWCCLEFLYCLMTNSCC